MTTKTSVLFSILLSTSIANAKPASYAKVFVQSVIIGQIVAATSMALDYLHWSTDGYEIINSLVIAPNTRFETTMSMLLSLISVYYTKRTSDTKWRNCLHLPLEFIIRLYGLTTGFISSLVAIVAMDVNPVPIWIDLEPPMKTYKISPDLYLGSASWIVSMLAARYASALSTNKPLYSAKDYLAYHTAQKYTFGASETSSQFFKDLEDLTGHTPT